MSAVQTSYSERIALGLPGQVASESTHDIDSRTVETAAGIGFGCAVTKGTADKGIVLGGAVAGFAGVAVRDATVRPTDTDEYAQYDDAGVLMRGDIFVTTKNIVAAGGDVYYDSTTGLWDDAASGNVGPVKGAVWVTSAAAAAIAVLRLTGSQHDN